VEDNMNQHVFVVEDDDCLRQSLQWMLSSSGLQVQAFASAEAFLEHYDPSMSGCIVVDMCMPGISGLELQNKLEQEHWSIPVILMSAFGDVPTAVRAMRAGAIDFIQKPFKQRALLERIEQAFQQDAAVRRRQSQLMEFDRHIDRLTPREHQVMELIIAGHSSKQIAYIWGVSVRTIEVHRSRIMRKMEADSIAELVLMVARSGIAPQSAA